MKKIIFYARTAFYHIKRNKAYSVFSITGTAMTFLFINVILQFVYFQIADVPPNINMQRIIAISSLKNIEDKPLLLTNAEAHSILAEIKENETFSLCKSIVHNVSINGKIYILQCNYVNSGLWNIKRHTLLEGRFFTKEECDNRTNGIIVREGVAKKLFTGSALGQTVSIMKKEYKIVGVIKDYPFSIGPGGIPPAIWIPYTLSDKDQWQVEILFPENVNMENVKERVARSLNNLMYQKGDGSTFTTDKISTKKEVKSREMKDILIIFSSAIIFILLLIPALNMFTLNLAGINNRSSEFAIQRAFGASKASILSHIIAENILMTLLGAIIGICLSYPFVSCMETLLIPPTSEGASLQIGVNLPVLLLGALPLILLLSFISGGIPAYIVVKHNIAKTLKGGDKC